MYAPVYLNRFEKDLKRMQKRGKDIGKFKTVALKLMAGEVLEPRYLNSQNPHIPEKKPPSHNES